MARGPCSLKSCLLVSVLCAPALAFAQPYEPPPPGDMGGPIEPQTQPAPPPPVEPAPSPPAAAPAPPAEAAADADVEAPADEPGRPTGFTVGIGVGYDLPTDLSLPDTTTVRFRLASGLTFEPFLVLGASGTSYDFEAGDSNSDSASEVGVGTNVRFPVFANGPVDLVLVGGARVDRARTNPDGADNDTTAVSTSLLWGLGLEYWLGPHGVFSLTATNPLVSYSSTTENQFDGEVTTSNWAVGAIFRPDVFLLAHLFL